MMCDKLEKAIVLIDPVSSGRFLKEYVPQLGYKLIGIFTLSDEILKSAGKYIPYEEKIKHCDIVICSDDFEIILTKLQKLPYQIVAAIPASEPAVELADKLANKLKLKGNSLSTSSARRDKYHMRCAVRDYGLPSPFFAACYSKDEALMFANRHGLPVVVKTPKGAGAHHVFVCSNVREVEDAYQRIMGQENVFGEKAAFVLVESFISGTQYVVELFGDGKNLQMTSMWKIGVIRTDEGRSFFDRFDIITSTDEVENFQAIQDYAVGVGNALGVEWGPCLVELRDEPTRGPLLIEAGARLAGLDIPLMVKEISNFDPFKSTLEVYLNDSNFILKSPQYFKNACIVLCPVMQKGKVKEIEGIASIEKLLSHYMNYLYISKGDNINQTTDLATTPFYAYLLHEDKAQLERDIAETKQKFKVKFLDKSI